VSNDPWVQFWIMMGGIITTAIAWFFRDHIAKLTRKPKDRVEIIFDGYEQLLHKQQSELERKNHVIKQLETLSDELHQKLEKADQIIFDLKEDLKKERFEHRAVRRELGRLRSQYVHSPEAKQSS